MSGFNLSPALAGDPQGCFSGGGVGTGAGDTYVAMPTLDVKKKTFSEIAHEVHMSRNTAYKSLNCNW